MPAGAAKLPETVHFAPGSEAIAVAAGLAREPSLRDVPCRLFFDTSVYVC